jgi:hypothetical protein
VCTREGGEVGGERGSPWICLVAAMGNDGGDRGGAWSYRRHGLQFAMVPPKSDT